MFHEEFLVITAIGGRSRRLIWKGSSRLAIDHPVRWYLKRLPEGILAYETYDGKHVSRHSARAIWISYSSVESGEPIELPPAVRGRKRSLSLQIHPLKPIRAPFLPPLTPVERVAGTGNASQLFVFYGARKFLINYKRTPRGHYYAVVNRKLVFEYHRNEDGYDFTAHEEGLYFDIVKDGVPSRKAVGANVAMAFSESELSEGTIRWGTYWWRINRVVIPPALPPKALALEEEVTSEAVWSKRVSQIVVSSFIGVMLMILVQPMPKKLAEKKAPLQTQVALKAPKLVPKKPEPPKIVKVEPPKPEPAPKVAKAEPPKPTPKKATPAPPKQAAATPPPMPAVSKPVPQGPTPQQIAAQQAAKQRASLAASLSFLSPSQTRPMANVSNEKVSAKYNAMASGAPLKNSEALKNMAAGVPSANGPIDTRAARNINGAVSLPGARGKTLNGVQGKVSLNALYDPNAGGELGAGLSGKGIAMSGSGSISDGLIEKVLAKHIEKFQYCYEKALLSDSSLSGSIVMQWTIATDGTASDIKVVRTQMNNAALQNCISKELAKIHFPAPTGGSVTIKYPLAFSSATL